MDEDAIATLRAAWEDPEGQELVYEWGVVIFDYADKSHTDEEDHELSMAYAEWAGAPRARGNAKRSSARRKYLELCRRRMVKYALPEVYFDADAGTFQGTYDALSVAEVLLGSRFEIDELSALEALAFADVPEPEPDAPSDALDPGEEDEIGHPAFDPLDPSTWRGFRTVKAMLCPTGSVDAWAYRMTQFYRLALSRLALG